MTAAGSESPIGGGCLCGRVRYVAGAAYTFPHLCSCRQCQRWSGAPVVAWVDFPADAVTFEGPDGAPHWYRSSPKTERGCCRECGGTIAARDDGSPMLGITVASLDDPSGFRPRSWSFRDLAPGWLDANLAPEDSPTD
jgi:hypothetical protein